MEVKQISNSYLNSNTFILSDKSYDFCWLIDIGDIDKVLAEIPDNCEVGGVFITHTHYDHIYGINQLLAAFPQLVVFTSQYGSEALYSDKKNLSKYQESSMVFEGKNVKILSEGGCVQLFDNDIIHVVETPGHCPSCLTYYTDSFIFTGDSYIPSVKVVTKLPGGNREQALNSVKKIKELSQDMIICPGHGNIIYH